MHKPLQLRANFTMWFICAAISIGGCGTNEYGEVTIAEFGVSDDRDVILSVPTSAEVTLPIHCRIRNGRTVVFERTICNVEIKPNDGDGDRFKFICSNDRTIVGIVDAKVPDIRQLSHDDLGSTIYMIYDFGSEESFPGRSSDNHDYKTLLARWMVAVD